MNKKAIITGASSGIGYHISMKLCDMGYEVYGIGRDFSNASSVVSRENFHKIVCDITDINILHEVIMDIRKGVTLLINNAGAAYYGLHEELNYKDISTMVRTNLEAPMIITNLLLRELKQNKGSIINISSVTALMSSPHGCAYGACKAGISSFSRSLFDECRKYGVKVTAICPDMTSTNLYRNANFREDDDVMAHIEPAEIADTVEYILNMRQGLVMSEVVIKPQFHRIKKKD